MDAVAVLRARWPQATVVFLSVDDSDEVMLAALEAGAAGYLVKSAGGVDVIAAVRRAAEGEIVVPARQLAALLSRRRERAERSRRLDSLTPREREILGLMAEGMDNREVAARLSVSYATVRSHVRHLLGKLGARSKLEAVVRGQSRDQPPVGIGNEDPVRIALAQAQLGHGVHGRRKQRGPGDSGESAGCVLDRLLHRHHHPPAGRRQHLVEL